MPTRIRRLVTRLHPHATHANRKIKSSKKKYYRVKGKKKNPNMHDKKNGIQLAHAIKCYSSMRKELKKRM